MVVQVATVNPTLTTQASAGFSLSDTATAATYPLSLHDALPIFAFNLFGPDNATCTGSSAFTNTKAVTGNGPYTSNPFTPTAAGTYRWVASYSRSEERRVGKGW